MIYRALTLFNLLNQDILNQDVLFIKGVKIPNFFKKNASLQWEFCHQFLELYEDWILNPEGQFAYENEQVQICENDIVLDCGANMGMFAAYAASKGAKVYCFEPNINIRYLLEETQQLYPHNVEIIPKALSNKIGKEIFCETGNIGANHLISSVMNDKLPILNKYEVDIITLDSFLLEKNICPTFIKIDIEGSEGKMLEGSIKTISQFTPKVVIAAYHNQNDVFMIKNYFQQFNYNILSQRENVFIWKNE